MLTKYYGFGVFLGWIKHYITRSSVVCIGGPVLWRWWG